MKEEIHYDQIINANNPSISSTIIGEVKYLIGDFICPICTTNAKVVQTLILFCRRLSKWAKFSKCNQCSLWMTNISNLCMFSHILNIINHRVPYHPNWKSQNCPLWSGLYLTEHVNNYFHVTYITKP